jgi:hypothetical protein
MPFKHSEIYNQKWEDADEAETKREQEANPSWKPTTGVVAELAENKDKSMSTAYTVAGICSIVGLLINGFWGALIGAGIGFVIMVVVLAVQDGTKRF